jgi:phosphate starvation-inducible PhoH-like protein
LNNNVTTIRQVYLDPPDTKRLNALCGPFHQNLKQIEQRLAVHIHHRGHHFHVHGSLTAVTHAERLLTTLYEETLTNSDISSEMVHLMLQTSQSVVLDEVDSPSRFHISCVIYP